MDELKPATSQLVQDAGDVMGHKNQMDKINIRSVPVLSSTVSIVSSARDLGVVIDSRVSTTPSHRDKATDTLLSSLVKLIIV